MTYEDGTDEYGDYAMEGGRPYQPPTYEPEAALFDARGNQLTTWEPIGEGMGTYRLGIRAEPWGLIKYDFRPINSLGGGDVVHVPKPEITISSA